MVVVGGYMCPDETLNSHLGSLIIASADVSVSEETGVAASGFYSTLPVKLKLWVCILCSVDEDVEHHHPTRFHTKGQTVVIHH